jgi:hypothetical protein
VEFLAIVLRIISTINKENILQKSQNRLYSLFADCSVGKRLAVSRKAAHRGSIMCISLQKCVFL